MTAWVDLHLHTVRSDGAETPTQLIMRAAEHKEIVAIAITDHDTTDGIAEAQTAAVHTKINVLSGVEISAEFNGRELHVVGLGVHPDAESLRRQLRQITEMRMQRVHAIVNRLSRLGIPVAEHPLFKNSPPLSSWGRMHVATALYEMGVVKNVQAAFDQYLNRGRGAHVPKQLLPAHKAIEVIHDAGGLAFLAHPGLGDWMAARISVLLELPFDGMEVYHVSHTQACTQELLVMAEERNLLISGGSDCHGNVKGEGFLLGRIKTPLRHYERIVDVLGTNAS